MGTTEPRLRVAVVTLGEPRWLHALAEPFNKTLRDRGLAEHCCFLRLSRLGRVKGLTATLQSYILSGAARYWTSSLGVEGSLTNPDTPGGQDGGEEDPAAVHRRVQGRGGQAAAGGRQRTDRGRDRAGGEPRAAERVAQRAPGGRLGGGAGRPQGRAGRDPAAQA